MEGVLLGSLKKAVTLILTGNTELWGVVWLSLRCTLLACLAGGCTGVPLALLLARRNFFGKKGVLVFLHAMQALPTVVVGLFLYTFISRRGVLGTFDLLYSPTAITLGQFILLLPLVSLLAYTGLFRIDTRYRKIALTLGASPWQATWAVMREARVPLLAALCTAFGRGIAEVGVSMMLGGNIKGHTRTMTTAMALEYDKGEFSQALALGLVLLAVSFILNSSLYLLQREAEAA